MKITFKNVHHYNLADGPFRWATRAEVANESIMHFGSDMIADLVCPGGKGLRPRVFRGTIHPITHHKCELQFALMRYKLRSQSLTVNDHVMGNALRDRDPNSIRS